MKVCGIIVTYGDRFKYLSEVITELLHQEIDFIIIVDNNSAKESKLQLKELEKANSGKLKCLFLDQNYGSAVGYKAGLSYFTDQIKDLTANFVWLLDDDNKPDKDALKILCKEWKAVSSKISNHQFALLSLREDRKEYVTSAEMANSSMAFPSKNSFLGFHIGEVGKKIIKILTKSQPVSLEKKAYSSPIVKVPYAPYGGLFLQRRVIKEIGYPKEEFFLYSDDHEYSYRITSSGGSIFLIPQSKVIDIEQSWYVGEKHHFSFLAILKNPSFRVYYNIRNRIFFEKNYLQNNLPLYLVNSLIYSSFLLLFSFIKGSKSFSLIYRAIKDAFQNKISK